ncbi:hypothetical protein Trydic_g9477 [Trypoxylus dichotomus]
MAPVYTCNELMDMVLIYGQAQQKAAVAAQLYREKFPNRHHPVSQSFTAVIQRIRDTGEIKPHRGRGGGQKKSRHVLDAKEKILKKIEAGDPTLSTRVFARQLGVSRSTVWQILREIQFYPYHPPRESVLTLEDHPARVEFCEWFLHQCELNVDFMSNILITGESVFTRTGIRSFQSAPNIQQQFSVNVWAGILNGTLIGPFILPTQLTSTQYLHFLENNLPELLEDVPLNVRRDMWFLHEGAAPHFAREVRQYLRDVFACHRISQTGYVTWPARSPDLNPINFYLWEYMKQLVYHKSEINNVEDLQRRIQIAAVTIRKEDMQGCYESWLRRAQLCIVVNGNNFEHLL